MWYSVVLLSLLVAAVTSYTCDDNKYINGCTVPKGFTWKIHKFRKACNRHDICYKCGYTLKVSRKACDDKFRNDMRSTCGKKKSGWKHIIYNLKRKECVVAVDVYYAAVRSGGVLPMYWDYKNHRFCKTQAWVKDCMP